MIKFLYTIIFSCILAGILWFGWSWYHKSSSAPTITFEGPENIEAGVPFDLEIHVSNETDQVLRDVYLTVSLPKGVAFSDKSTDENKRKKTMGTMGVGSVTSEMVRLIILTPQEEAHRLRASVEYAPESVGSSFKQVATWDISTQQSAIRLTARAPQKVESGEEYTMTILYENTSSQDIDEVSVDIEYPPIFKYSDASLEPTNNTNHWDLGVIKSKSSDTFEVTGQLIGADEGSFEFIVTLSTKIDGESHVLAKETISSAVETAPVALTVLAQETSEHIARAGEEIKYSIEYDYLSDSSSGSDNATIRAKLNGAMFDFNSLVIGPPEGTLDAEKATIIWQLKDLPKKGLVYFSIKTKEEYPIRRLSDRNMVVVVEATMEDGKYASVGRNETKIAGDAEVDVQVFFRDAEGGIVNRGPFPPEVNKETEYAVHWKIKNYTTDIRDVVVRAIIPAHVTFISSRSETSGKVSFDSDRREIVWEVGRIQATKGVVSSSVEAIFQIKAKPPENFAQQFLPLIGETRITAIDDFTDLLIESSDVPITSELPDDATARGEGRVK